MANPCDMENPIFNPLQGDGLTSKTQPEFTRGVSPKILLTHVKNTAPFIFNETFLLGTNHRFIKLLRHTDQWLSKFPESELDHAAYFELCVAAHWATIATFVPTDVDNQIRFRLWHPALPLETLFAMVAVVEEALSWDSSIVSTRGAASPLSHDYISGHHGEWFSISVAAYAALRKRHPERSHALAQTILKELERQLQVFTDFRQCRDGIGSLKSATIVAHNAGDFVRVMDLWKLDPDDLLRREFSQRCSSLFLNGAFI
ncbi:MAG: hypothetical protein ACKOA8_13910, partial [Deltaproteobacteria bacterium]